MSRGVLVVGASSPIGRAIGRAFAAAGDTVVGAALDRPGEPSYAVELVLDCATAAGAEAAVAATVDAAGRLDVVVLAAAVMPVAAVTATTDAQWRSALDATLGTAFAVSRAALPVLPRGGAIVAVSSVNATLAAPGLPAYAAAKAGLEGLVRQLALEYGPAGVRVNAVAPGLIGGADLPDAAAGYPLGRTGTPEEVAAAVLFLAGAGFVTGAVVPVDGGLSIASPAAFLRDDLRARWLE
ncbi:SDR family oxidoreductase [Micromonospora sp. DR5-3]|uniref:SDR family NAD(P)-dependent oxidoreductase n=1 Tax=unclassified Micromonospora TaxID=2617518 RepID=UPI0011D2F1BF|nr:MULTISPECIES: SDR family oxidoreductase [unclassified Micromonospora]MCW3814420.1 SDR family oxidoreductase [Micromonospora sp. DR5-3]TYC19703.1 SDR family oxidoreductase [Micromonospora sp. MP36]